MHRPFALPVVLSLALHGLAVAALGTFPLALTVTPDQTAGIKVDLVDVRPVPRARSKNLSAKAMVRRAPTASGRTAAVKRASTRAVAAAAPRARSVSTPVAMPSVSPLHVAPAAPVAADSEAPPAFMDLPRAPAPAAAPAAVFTHAGTFAVPAGMESLDNGVALSVSAGALSISRPVALSSSGVTRLLRDSTPEAGSIQSRVRPGNNPRPEYPRTAREAGWEGTVVLQVLVLPDGTAGHVTLHKTSGYSILDEAALAAVKNWLFVPAMDGNFPVKSMVRMPVRFDLKAAN